MHNAYAKGVADLPAKPATEKLRAVVVEYPSLRAGGGEVRLIMIEDICYLRADIKYTTVATASAQFLLSLTLKLVKEKLDPRAFWQIHRSVVVNVGAIRAVHRSFRGTLEVKLKERPEVLPVSAVYAHLFKHL